MSRASGFAITLAAVLSWFAVSCSGPVLFKPPAGSAVANAPTTQEIAATTQSVADVAAANPTPLNGAAIFGLFALALLLTIFASSLVFRGKPAGKP